MSQLDAILVPNATLSSERLMGLGLALREWLDSAQEQGMGSFLDPGPIADLVAGELPQPFALRVIETGEYEDKSSKTLLKELGPSGSVRIVRLGFNPVPEGMTALGLIQQLRQYVPGGTVERVIIDDKDFDLD